MIKMHSWVTKLMLVFILTGGLAACGIGPSDPGRYFILAGDDGLPKWDQAASARVGIGPVTLPPHLDRTQIVTQATANRLDLTTVDQWAEPLKDGVSRVIAQNVSTLTGSGTIYQFPWRRPVTVDYQIVIAVQRFDTDASGTSVLSARWDLMADEGRRLLFSRASTYRRQAETGSVEGQVAAMSANLSELSLEIVASLQALRN